MGKDLSIGPRVKALREEAGLTQQQLAARAGLSISLITHLEQGHRPDPRISTLVSLAAALGVGVAAFLEGGAKKARVRKGKRT